MTTTPKYRWGQITFAFAFGILFGFLCDFGVGLSLGFSAVLIHWLIPSIPDPPGWVLVPCVLAMAGLPIYFAVAWAIEEARAQLAEDRAASNHCLQCGYSLRGIRRISDRCPECGKAFKKLS